MADEQMYQTGAYVNDDANLFEVVRVQKKGPSTPRQRRSVTLEDCVSGGEHTVEDTVFNKRYAFVCMRLTDEELYLRYKAIGREYVVEPRPKPPSYGEELAAKLAAKRGLSTCR